MTDNKLCPKVESAFKLFSKKWTGLIIHVLSEGPKRFSDISATIPNLSDRMLTKRFKELEENGIIDRKVYPETPVRIEYKLTEKGKALKPVMKAMETWAEEWM
ncbi:putative transcriptional regulator [Halobacteroides halobius DSM 5150]|uniref:Putative transcriptional regulator n=1 Tax=Halobacteroides halobius (strain ATCC 35273 / DSM 5150 / MD-1) TaxID=748449 RepID=L0KD32_HALHC|nr:helix-turn-helix domain-containing protein [Halobacteroides halobius]AGB42455.1 putative transcriptional regulator [Halobacteroides halobius DSM 5150]